MKNWKQKRIIVILAVIILALAITTCDDGGNGSNTHTHSYGTTWHYNETQHWNKCECGDKANIANHTFDGDVCTVCGYDKNSGVPDDIFTVTSTSQWTGVLAAIRNGGSGTTGSPKLYTITVNGTVLVDGLTSANNDTSGLGTVAHIEITLKGNGTLRLNSNGSIIRIGANQKLIIDSATLTLRGKTFDGYYVTHNNSATVYVSGATAALELKKGKITENYNYNDSYDGGGGVYISEGVFTMSGGTISDNGGILGGGVFVNGGTFTMSGGTISDNGGILGGGVFVNGSTFTMNGGTISGNYSRDLGGGVCVLDLYNNEGEDIPSTFTMNGGKIIDNSSDIGGGVSNGGTFTMSDGAVISGNTATGFGYGGGVNNGGIFTMNGGEISNNTANYTGSHDNGSGGGGVCNGGIFTMSGGEISNNTATSTKYASNGRGGGVYILDSEGAEFIMNGGKISGNTAEERGNNGGGGGVCADGKFTMNDGEIIGNTAQRGGGLFVGWRGKSTMNGGTIAGNNESYDSFIYGGGVYVSSGTFTMNDGEITRNAGDGVYSLGHFNMLGGEITSHEWSSGVFLTAGFFNMSGGEISGNSNRGVHISGGSFTKSGGGTITDDNGNFVVWWGNGQRYTTLSEEDDISTSDPTHNWNQ